MISTYGHSLIQESAKQVRLGHIFTQVDLPTPNKLKVEARFNRNLQALQDVKQFACYLLKVGIQAVYTKGCHWFGCAQQDIADTTTESLSC
jgi:hydroxymethylpyrimidine/phosphomethylpyrimidine kinase